MGIGEKIHFKPLKNVVLHGYSIRPEQQVCLLRTTFILSKEKYVP
jgi:hypothetical protein